MCVSRRFVGFRQTLDRRRDSGSRLDYIRALCRRGRTLASAAPILVEADAGLALLNPFGSAHHNALADSKGREVALVAFLVTASGVTIYGVGGAFWGPVVGGAVMILTRAGAPPTHQPP
jgi:hypothetical protein